MLNYHLRGMTDDDLEFVYRAKKDAFKRYIVENWGSWDETAQKEYFEHFLEDYRGNIQIIRADNQNIGFVAAHIVGNGNYHIGTIVIIPEYQNHQIGTRIIRDIIKRYGDKRNIEVKYFKKNPVEHLYKKLGFIPAGESEYHYHAVRKKTRAYSPANFSQIDMMEK